MFTKKVASSWLEWKTKKTKSGPRDYLYDRYTKYNKPDHPRIRVTEAELDRQVFEVFDKIRIEDDGFAIGTAPCWHRKPRMLKPTLVPSYTLALAGGTPIGQTINMTSNDFDQDSGDAKVVTILTDPANGTLTGTGPSRIYKPNLLPGGNGFFTGNDSFRYQINDGIATSTATVTINVKNSKPVGRDNFYTFAHGTPSFTANVLTNDADAEGNPLTATLVGSSSAVTLSPSG